MNRDFDSNPEALDVRVEFFPEHASDFLYENEDGSQPLIATFQTDNIGEVVTYAQEFEGAIADINVYFRKNGKVVSLSDFSYEA